MGRISLYLFCSRLLLYRVVDVAFSPAAFGLSRINTSLVNKNTFGSLILEKLPNEWMRRSVITVDL